MDEKNCVKMDLGQSSRKQIQIKVTDASSLFPHSVISISNFSPIKCQHGKQKEKLKSKGLNICKQKAEKEQDNTQENRGGFKQRVLQTAIFLLTNHTNNKLIESKFMC